MHTSIRRDDETLAGCVAFAPVPEEGVEELDGLRIARELAEEAAGI